MIPIIQSRLRDVLDVLTDPTTGCAVEPLPCRVLLAPGTPVTLDACSTGDCSGGLDGQLWAAVSTVTATVTGPGCTQYLWTGEVGIVRCAAVVSDDGSPPPAEAVEADAWQQGRDAEAIRWALTCCPDLDGLRAEIELTGWNPIPPQGGCVGGSWQVRGVLQQCC